MPQATGVTDLHSLPDVRAREGIPLLPLLDPETTHRDSARPVPHREADQDLVPEPEDEAEEGAEGRQGDQRAGQERARGAGEAATAAPGEAAGEDGPAADAHLPAPAPPRPREDEHRQDGRLGRAEGGVEGADINESLECLREVVNSLRECGTDDGL